MNSFDSYIIYSLNNISSNSTINNLMLLLTHNDLLKGGIVVSLLWYFWFRSNSNLETKEKVMTIVISCLLALAAGRILVHTLPLRIRPFLDPHLSYLYPFYGEKPNWVDTSNSMPSDHAVMFYALATGIFLISKRIGLIVLLYVSVFILFPRIYLGYHYPTDVLAGGIVGSMFVLLFSKLKIGNYLSKKAVSFSVKYTAAFTVLFFLLTFQMGTMFDSTRQIFKFLATEILHF